MRSFFIAASGALVALGSTVFASACSVNASPPDLSKFDLDASGFWDTSDWGHPTGDAGGPGADSAAPPPKKDGGSLHPPPDASQPNTCAPQPVGNFVAAWHAPRPKQTACSSTQISDYYASCLSPTASTTSCQGFQSNTANSACTQCLAPSSPTDATYGPILSDNTFVEVNIAGCVAISQNDQTPPGCARKLQASSQCAAQACDSVCPVSDDASLTARQNCEDDSNSGVCSSYANDANSACASVTTCTGSTFPELFGSVAATMCGQ
jgi:hypothetical protein